MIRLEQAVIVEGKYDKIKLSSVLDALIIPTDGFGIFKDKEKLELIRKLARSRGVIIMTDSDSAGFMIRSYLGGCLKGGDVRHAYIPDILGKEKRKIKPGAEGKLGVEGVSSGVVLEALRKAGVLACPAPVRTREISRADLFEDGLTGGRDSKSRRTALLRSLDLPERLSSGSMLEVLNAILTYEEYKAAVSRLDAR